LSTGTDRPGKPSGLQRPSRRRPIRPANFAGTYSFYHDGWRGWLVLAHEDERRLTGSYRGDPGEGEFAVTAEVKSDPPHGVTITIHEFNWMVRQEFNGYMLRESRNGIAGSTVWAGDRQPYGFFARKTASLVLGRFPGAGEPVRPEDFGGRYAVSDDGKPGVLSMLVDAQGSVHGSLWTDGSARAIAVSGRVDGTVAHAVELTIGEHAAGDGRRFVGYLFSKTKNAIAGWSEAGDVATGFYMTKLSPARGARPERSNGA
jgi:hypothetical protein